MQQTRSWRIAPHPQRIASEWWDRARVSPRAPESVRPLLDPIPRDEIRVSEPEAAAIGRWAASLPGWQGDAPGLPNPLVIEPVPG